MKYTNAKRHHFVGVKASQFCALCCFPAADHKGPHKWYHSGFGLFTIQAISKRVPKWENGVFHLGGISEGVWILANGLDPKASKRVEGVLDLYKSEKQFLDDNS